MLRIALLCSLLSFNLLAQAEAEPYNRVNSRLRQQEVAMIYWWPP